MIWRVGMKAVCIKGPDGFSPPPNAEKGTIYTVSEVFLDASDIMLQFEELRFDGWDDGGRWWHPGFIAACFRPVVEADISIFTEMLNTAPETVPA